jgi:uncharacterized Fe-S cluster protein YjdI
MPKKTFTYSSKDLNVVWKPDLCIHSGICVRGLPGVFDSARKPWIDLSESDEETIISQVKKCPSGALSYFINQAAGGGIDPVAESRQITEIQITPNGPILIKNDCTITHSDGREELKSGTIALCRCGHSENKPYCDGSHKRFGFIG